MQLLPGDKILLVSGFIICLYDIEVMANFPSADPPTWPHPLPT